MAAHSPHDDAGRVRHYAQFYGLEELPGREVLLVVGNCQAEALRQLISSGKEALPPSVRVPPVFELTAADLPHLHRILARTSVLVAQPIRAGYRGLPLGSRELAAALPAGSRTVPVPVLYDSSLFPWMATIRHPDRPEEDPPLVPYHDLRTLAEAATELDGGRRAPADPPAVRLALDPNRIRALAAASRERLRERERAHGTLVVSDALPGLRGPGFHTINHPGNEVLALLASRVRSHLRVDSDVQVPQRTLLGDVLAPLEEQILAALDLTGPPRPAWVLGTRPVGDAQVRAAHLQWYRDHPQVVRAGVERHRNLLAELGLAA